jgi:hypothetical protein
VKRRTYLLIKNLRAFRLRHDPPPSDPQMRRTWAASIRRVRRLGQSDYWREQHILNAMEKGL